MVLGFYAVSVQLCGWFYIVV